MILTTGNVVTGQYVVGEGKGIQEVVIPDKSTVSIEQVGIGEVTFIPKSDTKIYILHNTGDIHITNVASKDIEVDEDDPQYLNVVVKRNIPISIKAPGAVLSILGLVEPSIHPKTLTK